jgi:hypothetical protein
MAFNHYAKIKRILQSTETEWYIKRIDEPTTAKNFKGENRTFDHYYRIYDFTGKQIPYCKFQQIELFAKTMGLDMSIIDDRIISEG